MAYARFGQDSDVYVYADSRGGYTCLRCARFAGEFRCATAAEMVTHLLRVHRAKGELVPDEAIAELQRETDDCGTVRDVLVSANGDLRAQIYCATEGGYQVWISQAIANTDWSPIGWGPAVADTFERAKALAQAELRKARRRR